MSPRVPQASEASILVLTCAGHLLTHIYLQLFTAIRPEMQTAFGLESDGLTRCASVSMVLFGAGALPAGWLSDRYGEKPLLVAFYLLTAAGGAVIGWAPTTPVLVAGFALTGLGLSIYHPVGLALISKSLSRPGRAMGINGMFGGLGTASAPLVASQITMATGDWRQAYLLLTIPTVLLGLWMATTHVDSRVARHAESRARAEVSVQNGRRPLVTVFVLLLGAMLCGGVYFSLTTTALPLHLGESGVIEGLSDEARRGWITFLVLSVGGAAQVLAGLWIERREGRGIYAIVLGAAVPFMLLTGWLDGWGRVGAAAAMTYFTFSVQPIENTLLSRYTPPALRGVVFGLKFVLVFAAGMGTGTALAGQLETTWGTWAAFPAAAAVTTVAFICALIAMRVRLIRARS